MDKKFRCVNAFAWDGLAYLAGVVLSLFSNRPLKFFDCWHCDLGGRDGWDGSFGYWDLSFRDCFAFKGWDKLHKGDGKK